MIDVGQRRLARAVGAHQGVDLALADGEVEALEDLLVPGLDVEVADLEVGHVLFRVVVSESGGDGRRGRRRRPACARRRRRARRAWSAASALMTPPWTRVHSSLVAQPCPWSATCEHSTRPSSESSTKHVIGRDGALEREDGLVHVDRSRGRATGGSRRARRGCSRRGRPSSAARRCARGRRAAGPRPRRSPSARPGVPGALAAELDEQAHAVLRLRREDHGLNPTNAVGDPRGHGRRARPRMKARFKHPRIVEGCAGPSG